MKGFLAKVNNPNPRPPSPQNVEDVLMEKIEEELDTWNMTDDYFSYVAVYMEGKEPIDFEGKSLSLQDFKLYFLESFL